MVVPPPFAVDATVQVAVCTFWTDVLYSTYSDNSQALLSYLFYALAVQALLYSVSSEIGSTGPMPSRSAFYPVA